MYSNDRGEMRKVFFEAWRKHQHKLPLATLEAQLLDIMLEHSEYHAILDDPASFQEENFGAENPFLHMSLHLAIREQVATDRPPGIKTIYTNLRCKLADTLKVEHAMMYCLSEVLWEAQERNTMPDEQNYLAALANL
ncbi:MAG: DUF1841 family protein [Pseudomonadota bacterium]